MSDIYTSRKVLSGLLILAVGIVTVLIKGDIPPNFLSLLQWTYGSFVLGNGVQYVANAMSSKQQ